jgi:Cd2+/Zn2+-exporting ATPase
VKVGEILLVKPGERIPVDAVIRKGISSVDESSITGEPIPREKTIGDKVYAGTLNHNGVIEIETTKVGENTTLGKVIKLVSEAEAHRPQAVRLVDRYARWFTPVILSCAGLAWLVTGDVDRAITVLIVGCPCALVLAAPTATVAAIGRAARAGILIKKGQFIEQSARADVVLFDKTGTLTQGSPRVDNIIPAAGLDDREVLTLAASVEKNSTHPFARAVLKAAHYARVTLIKAEEVCTRIGLGVQACVGGKHIQIGSAYIGGGGTMSLPVELRRSLANIKERGATPLVVYKDRQPMGIISVSDQVRSSSAKTVRMLKDLGIRQVGVLSGDHERSVRIVAGSVGVKDAWSEMKPKDKLCVIRDFQASENVVMFVGDGINDAPALASANVGIAMGAFGTDVALDTADIALMNDDISKIPFLINLGRRMNRIIKFNITFGLLFNAAAVLASGGGFLSPIMGAVVHNIGSVIVVLCSSSIAFTREKQL